MFPKRKTHLNGHEYQCKRTQRGPAIEDIPRLVKRWQDQGHKVTHKENGDFIVSGCLVPGPARHREEWDIVSFSNPVYFKFQGERIYMKFINGYDPENGTFFTSDAFWQLYPLPEA